MFSIIEQFIASLQRLLLLDICSTYTPPVILDMVLFKPALVNSPCAPRDLNIYSNNVADFEWQGTELQELPG